MSTEECLYESWNSSRDVRSCQIHVSCRCCYMPISYVEIFSPYTSIYYSSIISQKMYKNYCFLEVLSSISLSLSLYIYVYMYSTQSFVCSEVQDRRQLGSQATSAYNTNIWLKTKIL